MSKKISSNEHRQKNPLPRRLKNLAEKAAQKSLRWFGYSKEEATYRTSLASQRLAKPFQAKQSPTVELCVVIPKKSKGWILEAVCREIAQHFAGTSVIADNYEKLPLAKAYFFCHYHFYLKAVTMHPHLWDRRCVVWITHPKEENFGGASTIFGLKQARLVTMCSMWRDLLIQLGSDPRRVKTILGAADPDFFHTHQRGHGKIGICAAYYERKSPTRILDVVRSRPDRSFVLLGRGWEAFEHFEALRSLPNFEYRQAPYSEYPGFYSELDVFLSLSELEGGPIPLIESMMSNVMPVATRTGFAPDLITHGRNGYLCPIDATASEIGLLIDQALANTSDVRQTVEHLSWQNFSEQMLVELGLLAERQQKIAA